MAATKRNPSQIQKDRLKITDLRLEGYTQREIAARMKMTQQMVAYDLKAIELEWEQSRGELIDRQKARELAVLNKLYREALRNWKKSLRKANGGPIGDARFLEQALKCSKDRRELMGLDAPKQMKHSGFVGTFDPSKCTMEQLERIRNGEDPGLVLQQNPN
jgi:transcriptional regulator with XRE-family HTH domain